MLTKKVEKVGNNFHCECCDYSSSRSEVFKNHLLTSKHNKANKLLTNANEKVESWYKYILLKFELRELFSFYQRVKRELKNGHLFLSFFGK
jgi:hypothetical protein